MVEAGHRYSGLFWAGEYEIWKCTGHQLEHIIEAIEDGLKRRPIRAASAEFMEKSIPEMEEAIGSGNKKCILNRV